MNPTLRKRVDPLASPHDAFQMATSIGLHFKGKYDCFKYNFKCGKNFEKMFRPNEYTFRKLVQRYPNREHLMMYFVANQMDQVTWPGNMTDRPLIKLQRTLQSFEYIFANDLKLLYADNPDFDYHLKSKNGEIPPIITNGLKEMISMETVIVIHILTGFLTDANKKVADTLLWDDVYGNLMKYHPFIRRWINTSKPKLLLIKQFTS